MPTNNSTSSIESLYLAHNSWLRGWLYRRLSNATDAADLAQDTFVRLMQRRLGAPIDEPRAYLRTVARGLVIDLWRHRDIERAWLETLEHLPQEYELSPETSALAMECLVAIDRLLDELRPEIRLAFLLAQLEGLKCPAIALRLGVSVATVERYIAKALRHCYSATFECPR